MHLLTCDYDIKNKLALRNRHTHMYIMYQNILGKVQEQPKKHLDKKKETINIRKN